MENDIENGSSFSSCWCLIREENKYLIWGAEALPNRYDCMWLILLSWKHEIRWKRVCCRKGIPYGFDSVVKIYAMIYWAFIDTSMWFRWLMGPVFCVGVLSVHFFSYHLQQQWTESHYTSDSSLLSDGGWFCSLCLWWKKELSTKKYYIFLRKKNSFMTWKSSSYLWL